MKRLGPHIASLFQAFHGHRAGKPKITEFHDPKSLVYLGKAVAIVYESDKKNGGGDGRLNAFIHEFETPVGLYMDERAEKQLYLLGRALRVSDAGIEN